MAYGTLGAKIIDSTTVEHSPRGAALRKAAAEMRKKHSLPPSAPLIVDGCGPTLEPTPDSGHFLHAIYTGTPGGRHSYELELCHRAN
jgi:hypothetical protein